ncbi:transposase [Histoplasma capsulatum G186AR]|uniref:Transposase n=1 Tax=Ajellomyces capsulatus TaxID=5037 RepID=A0A8H8D736_AJECA|nr:transposase [Histoplasma capsulatum]QSS68840.1 transposase [Histoplasma capsulatum G186AR]
MATMTSTMESPKLSPATTQTRTQTHRRRLNREERKDILVLRRLGYTYQAIAEHLHVSHRAVQYTCESNTCDPKKRPGRNSKLSTKQVDDIEAFLAASKENRKMSYKKIIEVLGLDVKQDCLRRALQKRGYTRQATSMPNFRSSKRSDLAWEICKNPDTSSKDQNEHESSAGLLLPDHPSPGGPLHHHHRQPATGQPQAPFTRYPHIPTSYQGYHSSASPQSQPVQLPHLPGPYHQAAPPEFQHLPQQYNSMAAHHHPQQPQPLQQQYSPQCRSIPLEPRSIPPQNNPVHLHPHSLSTAIPPYHSLHEYHSVSSNKSRPPLPEYRRALSEYCPSLIDRRSVSVQTPSPFQSPSFASVHIDPRHQNLSRSASPGLCQTTNSHAQMLVDVSSMTDRSQKSSGYSTPLTIPDDRSDYYRYETSVPPEMAGVDSEPRLRWQ